MKHEHTRFAMNVPNGMYKLIKEEAKKYNITMTLFVLRALTERLTAELKREHGL